MSAFFTNTQSSSLYTYLNSINPLNLLNEVKDYERDHTFMILIPILITKWMKCIDLGWNTGKSPEFGNRGPSTGRLWMDERLTSES